jgi:hypothetical protein
MKTNLMWCVLMAALLGSTVLPSEARGGSRDAKSGRSAFSVSRKVCWGDMVALESGPFVSKLADRMGVSSAFRYDVARDEFIVRLFGPRKDRAEAERDAADLGAQVREQTWWVAGRDRVAMDAVKVRVLYTCDGEDPANPVTWTSTAAATR